MRGLGETQLSQSDLFLFCEMNGLTSPSSQDLSSSNKMQGKEREVLNIRVSVADDKSVCTPASVHFCKKQTCHPSHAETEDVFEREALRGEYVRREVYLGSEEGKGAPLTARCFNIPSSSPPPPPLSAVCTDMPAGTGMGSVLLPPLRSTVVSKEMIHG